MTDEDRRADEAWRERHPDPTLADVVYAVMVTSYFIVINLILLFQFYIFQTRYMELLLGMLPFVRSADDYCGFALLKTLLIAMVMMYYSCNVGLTVSGEHWHWYWNAFLELSKLFVVVMALETAVAAVIGIGIELCRECGCVGESGIAQQDEEAALVNESAGIELDDVDKLAATHEECGDSLRRKRLEYFVQKFERGGDDEEVNGSCIAASCADKYSKDVEQEGKCRNVYVE